MIHSELILLAGFKVYEQTYFGTANRYHVLTSQQDRNEERAIAQALKFDTINID